MSAPSPGPRDAASKPAAVAVLADVLFAGERGTGPAERDWTTLVQYVAAGDQRALRELFERAHRLVYTFIARLTNSRELADELTIDVFYEVWKLAPKYGGADGPVLAWLKRIARATALARIKREQAFDADVLSPTTPLWGAIAKRVAAESGRFPAVTVPFDWREPLWDEVAPGISCKLLAADEHGDRVSMLVRLKPGTAYPPHTHAGTEELYLLDGELWIDKRKLHPGDYNHAEAGTSDHRVWSATGCTCVLVTSLRDRLG